MTIGAGRLSSPRQDGDISLEKAIRIRRSVRAYQNRPVEETSLSQLLWAGQGLRPSSGFRNAPSAGGLHPLEIYTVLSHAIYHYQSRDHSLTLTRSGDLRGPLMHAALDQEFIAQAPLTIVITAVPERTAKKYGKERAPRYIDIEVGHVAQNLLLQAAALGLGSVPVGAFNDAEVTQILQLPSEIMVRYLLPIGYAAEER
jgi:SagB-type dehydrogenase family enzyme